jgi:DNA-directed RNA polymerase sigma subunit (sigma70/sigma32)
VVADFMEEFKFDGFSDEEIGDILGITKEEVNQIAEEALRNIRLSLRKQLISIE